MRQQIDLNNDWEFTEAWTMEFAEGKSVEAESVRLPHTCREVPFHYFDESLYQMKGGYRRRIHAPEEWKTKRVILTLGAAGHYAARYRNNG